VTTQSPSNADIKDRKTALLVFGVLEIVFGALCSLMVPFMMFGMLTTVVLEESSTPSTDARMIAPSMLFYILLAVWLIVMGIGSAMARRWARALVLVTSWLWFITGIVASAVMWWMLPDMYDEAIKSNQMPQEVVNVVKFVTFGFSAIIYLFIPGALICFYGSKHVKATCEEWDTCIRWTDKCPLPVLAVSLLAGFGVVCMLFMGFYDWAIPFFGIMLSGMNGAAVALVVMLLLGYVAWGTYRLSTRAWWCAMMLIIAWGVSVSMTFSRTHVMELYEMMKLPIEQLELMSSYALQKTSTLLQLSALWAVVAVAYLIYTKRYFARPFEVPRGSL
jgi:hypothetical protein